MRLPFLHRFIIQRIEKTLDDRTPPKPLLCLLMRLDKQAGDYYRERLALDDRLIADLAPFLGYEVDKSREILPEAEACNRFCPETRRAAPWRAKIVIACIAVLLGLTFAFNFCVVSPFRLPASPSQNSTATAKRSEDNNMASRPIFPGKRNEPVAGGQTSESSGSEHEFVTASGTILSQPTNGAILSGADDRDVMDLAASIILLPERNLWSEANEWLTQSKEATGAKAETEPEDHVGGDSAEFVFREVAHSNPLTKYIMDRYIDPVFASP